MKKVNIDILISQILIITGICYIMITFFGLIGSVLLMLLFFLSGWFKYIL